MGANNRSPLPLVRYRLARAALDLQSFTVFELAAMAAVPVNTVYSFLSDLGPSVAQEPLSGGAPGRPRKIYTLKNEAVETLRAGNFEVARMLQEAGIEAFPGPARAEVQESRESQSGIRLASLRKLYVEELKDLYSAEKQLLQELPRMARKAQSKTLRNTLEHHVEVTRAQVERLDRIFESLGKNPRGKKSRGMKGLIEETREILPEKAEPEILDAILVSNAKKIKHYEIAGYDTVRTYAELLGESEHARLLERTLKEEESTDQRLVQFSKIDLPAKAFA